MADHLYRPRPNGPWHCWYFTADGRRIRESTHCYDRKAALRYLAERERRALDPALAPPPPKSAALSEAIKKLVQHDRAGRSAATLEMYAKKGKQIMRVLGEDFDLGKMGRKDLERYFDVRREAGISLHTLHKEFITIRLAYRAVFDEDPPERIFPRFKLRYVPRDRRLTRDEVERLLVHLRPERRLWLLVAVYTGGRRSEVEGLTWEDVDWERRWVRLPGTKTARARRWVPIAEPLFEALAAVRQQTGPVVGRWANAQRDLALACKKAGVGRVSANDLRRTFTSWLKEQGHDSMLVAKLLGHSTSKMVELVYGHFSNRRLEDAIASMPKTPVPPPDVLAKRPRRRTRCRIKVAWIIEAVSQRLGVEAELLLSQNRSPKVLHARRVAMYLAWKLTDMTIAAIGTALGGHDPRSVTRALSRARAEERNDQPTAEMLAALEQHIKAPRYSTRWAPLRVGPPPPGPQRR